MHIFGSVLIFTAELETVLILAKINCSCLQRKLFLSISYNICTADKLVVIFM